MPKHQEIKQKIETIKLVKRFTDSYQRASVILMSRTRDKILSLRQYHESLIACYSEIKLSVSYKDRLNANNYYVANKPKDMVTVFLSGSAMFSGEINNNVFRNFLSFITSKKTDIVVVGLVGKKLFEQRGVFGNYKFFNDNFDEIKQYLLQYKQVNVFYGLFTNIVSQNVAFTNITGDIKVGESVPQKKYFGFEPSAYEVLSFFENNVFLILLSNLLKESFLGQLGARIKTLELTNNRADTLLKELKIHDWILKKEDENNKIVSSVFPYLSFDYLI